MLVRYTGPLVGEFYNDLAFLLAGSDPDLAAVVAVLDGIVDQIDKRLFQQGGVHNDFEIIGTAEIQSNPEVIEAYLGRGAAASSTIEVSSEAQ